MSQWQKDALAKQKGSPMKKSSPKVKKAQDAWSKKYLVNNGGINIKKLKKDGHPPFPTDKNYNRVIKKFPFLKEDWTVNIKLKEGSCGYGIDGNLGEEPAGPHLLKKKKKKKDEASLGSMMSKKIGKHRGTRDKGEIAKILKLLVKRGNKKKDAMDMINKNYDYVSKTYRKASPAKKAEILSSLQESINEAGMELKKLEDAIKMFQKKIKKQGSVTNARDEDHLKNLIKVYKQMGGKKIKEAIKLKGKSGMGTISHVGMPKASKGVEKLFKIADTGFGKVGGQTVDSMSANLFKQIYNKANDDIKRN